MSSVAVAEPFRVAVMVEDVFAPTDEVVTVKSAVMAPAGTVTVSGTVADSLSLESDTTAPPAGAGLLNVMVPVEALPPETVAGLRTTEETKGG